MVCGRNKELHLFFKEILWAEECVSADHLLYNSGGLGLTAGIVVSREYNERKREIAYFPLKHLDSGWKEMKYPCTWKKNPADRF